MTDYEGLKMSSDDYFTCVCIHRVLDIIAKHWRYQSISIAFWGKTKMPDIELVATKMNQYSSDNYVFEKENRL